MSRTRLAAHAVALGALLATPAALASGGPGGGGGGGGGGGKVCAPLTTLVRLGHADGNGNTGIGVQATIANCSSVFEPLRLTVSVPGSDTVPFAFSTGAAALGPGRSLTMSASPIGSTPLQLHFGQTYDVVATLTETGATPATLATISTPVTMPGGVIG
jgi:hypothetical protein